MKYIRSTRSWHIYLFTSRGGTHKSRCGLWFAPDAPRAASVPADERSCESCYRLTARDEEKA